MQKLLESLGWTGGNIAQQGMEQFALVLLAEVHHVHRDYGYAAHLALDLFLFMSRISPRLVPSLSSHCR